MLLSQHDASAPIEPRNSGLMRSARCVPKRPRPEGGGWGGPKTRDPQAVLADLRDGITATRRRAEIYALVPVETGEPRWNGGDAKAAGRAAGEAQAAASIRIVVVEFERSVRCRIERLSRKSG